MSEPQTKPSNTKQPSQNGLHVSPSAPENSPHSQQHPPLTCERSSQLQRTTACSVSLCVTTHIKIQLIHSPFKKGTQITSPSFLGGDRCWLQEGVLLNHSLPKSYQLPSPFARCICNIRRKKTLIVSNIWITSHQSCLHIGHVLFFLCSTAWIPVTPSQAQCH